MRIHVQIIAIASLTILLMTSFMSLTFAQEDFELTTSSVPACNAPDFITEWADVTNKSLGVAGEDPVGSYIATYSAWKPIAWWFDYGWNWYPMDVYKQTLCGRLHHYNFYDGGGDEADWNNFIIPSPDYSYILNDALPYADSDDVHDCEGNDDCMEAEITPDESYYDSVWFPKGPGNELAASPLEGTTLCTYGPWVTEASHGYRPEIHPSELYWWKKEGRTYLLLLQDDSNRFDRNGNFNVGAAPIPGWLPWSKWPRTGKFKIAFVVNTMAATSKRLRIFINSEDRREIRIDNSDVTNGVSHTLKYNGRPLLTVEENAADGDVQVGFEGICRGRFALGDPDAPQQLLGFVTLTSSVGNGDSGDEGYVLMRVEDSEQPATGPTVNPKDVSCSVKLTNVPTSLLACRNPNGKPGLCGDVEFESRPCGEVVSRVDLKASGQNRRLVFYSNTQGGIVVKNVPLMVNGDLKITTTRGQIFTTPLAPLSIMPVFDQPILKLEGDAPADWRAMVNAAGGTVQSASPPLEPVRVRQWEFQVAPIYVRMRGRAFEVPESSGVTATLNGLITDGDQTRRLQLLGSRQPFKLQWTLQAKDLTTGKRVLARIGRQARTQDVRVDFSPGVTPNGKLRVTFPTSSEGHVFEFFAEARFTDALGNSGSKKYHLWSHILSDDDQGRLSKTLLSATANAAGVSADQLVAFSGLENLRGDSRVRDQQFRRARSVHLAVIRAAKDKRITVGELRGLIRGAKLFQRR